MIVSDAYGLGYVVVGVYGDRATAVRVIDVTNPREWRCVIKATHSRLTDSCSESASREREEER